MTLYTVRHSATMMCTLPFSQQASHRKVVEQCRASDHVRSHIVTGTARMRSSDSEDKLPVRINHRVGRDLGQRPPMFRMTGETGVLLSHHLAMKVAHGRFGSSGKLFFRMTGHTLGRARAMERLMTAQALRHIHVIPAQGSGSPERFGTSDRPPPQPREKDDRHHNDHWNNCFKTARRMRNRAVLFGRRSRASIDSMSEELTIDGAFQ